MKTNRTNILLLFIVAIFTFSCSSDELEVNETESLNFEFLEKSNGKATNSNSSQIITIIFRDNATEAQKQTVRNLYIFGCEETIHPFLDVCGNNFNIEMYNPYPDGRNTEFWRLVTCDGSDLRFACPDAVKEAIGSDENIDSVQ